MVNGAGYQIPLPPNLNGNLLQIYGKFHSNGIVVLHASFNNKQLLIPQNRKRVWFLYAHCGNCGLEPEDALLRLERVKANIAQAVSVFGKKRLPMDTCTLHAEHAILLNEIDKLSKRFAQKDNINQKYLKASNNRWVKPKWYDEMRKVWETHQIVWIEPTCSSHIMHHVGAQELEPLRERTNIWYSSLPTREKYTLYLVERVFPRHGTEKRAFITSRSAQRAAVDRPTADRYPCTLPRTKVWLEWLDRVQTGTEKMATQGFFEQEFLDARLSQTALADLAGNAVSVPVTACILHHLVAEFADVLDVSRSGQTSSGSSSSSSTTNPPTTTRSGL